MSELDEFAKLCEIYDFMNYDFGPASDHPTLSRLALPERYKKASTRGDGNQIPRSAPEEP